MLGWNFSSYSSGSIVKGHVLYDHTILNVLGLSKDSGGSDLRRGLDDWNAEIKRVFLTEQTGQRMVGTMGM